MKLDMNNIPSHIAIILDGNGRWAKKRFMPRTYGHKIGTENIKTITLACKKLGVKVLSVYAFSTENWKRPQEEVDYLMSLPKEFEENFKEDFKNYDVRVIFSGRKTKISTEVREIMERIMENTKDRKGITLNICFDYGSYEELSQAVKKIASSVKNNELNIDDIDENTIEKHLYTSGLPKLDLLIRTSGEQRLSNFMLFQVAYSEFYFTKVHWPAFNEKCLVKAILNYQKRNRRFGGLKK